MKNARTIKEIIDNNVITKSETMPVGASSARPQTPKNDLNNKHKQSGITLIALIITIIILLILASITINLTLGERGIFNTAKRAVENYKDAEEREYAELNNFEQEMQNTIKGIVNNKEIQPVTNISMTPNTLIMNVGEKQTITAKIEPEDATNKTIEFISGNKDIVTIGKQTKNADGTVSVEVTAVGTGNTIITAKSEYGENGKEITEEVTINCRLYLYNEGDECVDVTGGWVESVRYDSANATESTIDKRPNEIYIKHPTGTKLWPIAQLCCKNPIDTGKYKTIHMVLSGSVGDFTYTTSWTVSCYINFYNSFQSEWNDKALVPEYEFGLGTTKKEVVTDKEYVGSVPNFECFPVIRSCTNDSGATAEFHIKSIWLE